MTPPPRPSDSGPSQPPPRASDADRVAVVRVLQDAVVRGLLTLEEGDQRMAAAFGATFVHDLPPLTADLPPAPPPAPVAPGWGALAALAWLQLRTALAAFSWRDVRARPRLAAAVLALVAVLSIAAGTTAGFDDHHPHGPRFEHIQPR